MSRALIDAQVAALNRLHRPYERAWRHPKQHTLTLCYEASRSDGRVWAVKVGRRWRLASHVRCEGVTLETVYKGLNARQPRAYLTGRGRVTWQGSQATVTR